MPGKYTDFIKLKINNVERILTILVDSQADASILKESSLKSHNKVNTNEKIQLQGITDGSISSLGSFDSKIPFQNNLIDQKWHIVPDSIRIHADGILGKDFLKPFKAAINYWSMTLDVPLNHSMFYIPILEGPEEGTILLPPRSECIRKIYLNNCTTPQVIENQQIEHGIFVPRMIIHPKNPIIRILNTSDEAKIIKTDSFVINSLNDYYVYQPNSRQNRTQKVIEILKRKFPEHVPKELIDLCSKYSDIFALDDELSTVNNFYQHKIQMNDQTPSYTKNYRIPHTHKTEIDSHVDKLLKNNLIEPSQAPYNSPVLLVPKKSVSDRKTWRLCVDYRALNKKVVSDTYPLPRIDEILDNLGRAKYFTILDLHAGFHQVPLHPSSRDYTTFSTPKGSFRFKVLPFGLKISPNAFARMMNLAFSGLPPEICFLYLDDIIVIGLSESNHLNNIQTVFEVCKKYNLKLNAQKCKFFHTEVVFLGHKCTQNGVLPDDTKKFVIEQYPRPKNKDDVKRFVAFANYYRRFIRLFAEIAAPLNRLTRKNTEFIWTQTCEEAFLKIKNSLISPEILQYPNFTQPFILTVDASNFACGAVLSQCVDSKDLPVAFASKSFQKAEVNKSTIEKELIAVHWAIKYFRPYLFGTKFTVKSDHRPLAYLFSMKDPSSRLTRMRLDLEEHDFVIQYIKGKNNVTADALSRISIDELKDTNINVSKFLPITRSMTRQMNAPVPIQDNIITEQTNIQVYEPLDTHNTTNLPCIRSLNLNSVHTAYLCVYRHAKGTAPYIQVSIPHNNSFSDYLFGEALLRLQRKAVENDIDEFKIYFDDPIFTIIHPNQFKALGNRILTKIKIYLVKPIITITDPNEKMHIMNKFHNDPISGGHPGQKRLHAKIAANFYWKNMRTDIAKYVNACHKCRTNKPKNANKEALFLTPTPQQPFEKLVIDTVGPLPKSINGNLYVLTTICDLTKFIVCIPIPNKEARTIADALLKNIILVYGPMKTILTDKGTEYLNSTLKELCALFNINKDHSTPYRHETLGSIERSHRSLNEYLRSYLEEANADWETNLKFFSYCYNTTPNTTLEFKYTPFELVYSKKPLSFDFMLSNRIDPLYNIDEFAKESKYRLQIAVKEAKKFVEKSKLKSKSMYDRNINPLNIKLGDQVMLIDFTRNKISDPIYKAPYVVEEIINTNLKIRNPQNNRIIEVHKNNVRKYGS